MILCDDGRTRNLRGKWSGGRHRGAVEAKGDERVSETVPGVLVVLFDFFPQDLRALPVFGCGFFLRAVFLGLGQVSTYWETWGSLES